MEPSGPEAIIRKSFLIIELLLVMAVGYAQRNIAISSAATTNGTWSGADPDVFTPSADDANIIYTDIQTRIAAGKSVTVTTAGGGGQPGNVTISNAITGVPTASGKTFLITASGTVTVNSSCVITLTPALNGGVQGTGLTFSAGTGISISSNIITSGNSNNNGNGGAGGAVSLSSTNGTVTASDLTTTGAASSNNGGGGAGGTVSITAANAASITVGTITTSGGAAPAGQNQPGGVGGAVTIADHTGTTSITAIVANSGSTANANATVGGAIRINSTTPTGGNVTIGSISNSGSSSTGNNGTGGAAGLITIKSSTGFINCTSTITSNGGNGYANTGGTGGALILAASTSVTVAGNILVAGGANPNGNNQTGGAGGTITITATSGDVTLANLTTTGGATTGGGAGGTGGAMSITAANASAIAIGVVNTSGGASTANYSGGNAGNFTIADHTGTTTITSITANGGTLAGVAAGANGGTISINATTPTGGNVTIGAISNVGTSPVGNNAAGGNAGNTTIKSSTGFVTCSSTINSMGGNGNGGNAGIGGNLTIAANTNVTISGTVNLSGGSGSQNFFNGGAAGAISITASTGNVSTANLSTIGGAALTWAAGGAGGAITITANNASTIGVGVITTSGGVGINTDNAGGAGGALNISGTSAAFTSTSAITTAGGNGGSNNANGGTGGAITIAASTIFITGGVTLSTVGGTPAGLGTSVGGAISVTGTAGITLGASLTSTGATTNAAITINDGNSTITSGGANDGQTAGTINCGTAIFTKTGTGNFILSQSNSCTGNTVITAGTLTISAADRIHNSSDLVLNGGTFSSGATTGYNETMDIANVNANSIIALGTGAHTITFSNSSAQAWAGSTLTITGWTGTAGNTGTAGKIFFASGLGTVTAGQLAKIRFAGYYGAATLLGTGEIVPTIPSTKTWDGGDVDDNLWTSATNWVGDVAPVEGDYLVFAGSTRLTPNNDFANETSFGSITFSLGAGNFTLSGNNFIIYGGSSAITGNHTSATMTIQNNLTFGTAAPTITTLSGGTLDITGTINNGGYAITNTCAGTLNVSGIISGTGGFTKDAAGTLTLAGANTYSGSTNVNGGTLKAGVITSAFGLNSAVTLANIAGVVLDITGYYNSIGSLTSGGATGGNVILGAATLNIGGNNTSPSAYAGVISGTGALIKLGTGTLILSGSNTYSGLTTISAGTLKLGATGNAPNTPLGTIAAGTIVESNATLDLGGFTLGTTEALTINGTGVGGTSGAIMNSGGSASFSGDITLASASTITADNQITLSGTILPSSQNLTTAGSNSLVFTSNTITVNNLAISAGTLVGGTSTINVYGDFTKIGEFTPNTNGVNMLGVTSQAIPATTFNNLTINNAAGATLLGNITINGILTLTAGILNTGVYTVDLGATGSIVEITPTAIAPTSYVIGAVKATRPLMLNVNNAFGGIGVELLETVKTNNSTQVIRTTGTGCVALTHTSITRYFTITPTDDSGLNGTMIFHYFDVEIAGHTEANLALYKSTDNRVSWLGYTPTRDLVNNKLTLAGISSFSDWTASDGINQILPIKLVSFTAKNTFNGILLEWTTETESNNNYFTIEQSYDGENWDRLARIKGAGNSVSKINYSFFDDYSYQGFVYYRIKQTDYNEQFTYSKIVTVEARNYDVIQCIMYPTPVSNSNCNLQISVPKTGNYTIQITDLAGRVKYTKDIEVKKSTENFNFSNEINLSSGMYYLRILKDSKTVLSQKIVWENQ
jgi:hypothetical protein